MKKYVVIVFVLAAVFAVSSVTYASVKPKTREIPRNQPASSTAETQFEQALSSRISEYSAFKSNMPSSISNRDKATLSAELYGAIRRMNASLATLEGTTTKGSVIHPETETASTTMSDALLSVKMSMLRIAFPPRPRIASTTRSLMLASFASAPPSATTAVSSNVIDQIIQLNSFANAQSLMEEVISESLQKTPISSASTTTATTTAD